MCGAIEEYLDEIKLNDPVSAQELGEVVASAVKDRAFIFYFVWKTIQELYPEVDADAIMAEASRRFGTYKSRNMGNVADAKSALLNQTSKAGMCAFHQTITKLTPEHSEKIIRRCPHMEAFTDLGCTREEKIKLCTELLMPGDYGLLSPFKNILLEFPKNLAMDEVCILSTKMK